MKKRRTLIISLLLIAALALGIGYAALTDTLDINGTADVNQAAAQEAFNEDIKFTNARVIKTEGTDLASLVDGDPDMATFTVNSLKGKDDTAVFEFTITNDGDLDALVDPSLAADGNSNAEYFKIFSDWNAEPRTIPAHSSATYTVTVQLLKTPTDTIHGAFHIELVATSGAATGA